MTACTVAVGQLAQKLWTSSRERNFVDWNAMSPPSLKKLPIGYYFIRGCPRGLDQIYRATTEWIQFGKVLLYFP